MIFGSPPIVTNGLVLNLDAGNMKSYPRSGTTWRDLSGLNNNGTLTNGPTFNSTNGGSIVFDGVDDYVNLGLSNIATNTDFSYSHWVKTSTTSVGIIYGADACGNSGGHYSFINASGSFGFRIIGDTSVIINSLQTGYNDNKWHYVCFTKNSSIISIYLDGSLSITGSTPANISTTRYTQYIGIRGGTLTNPAGCGTNYYLGNLAALSVYNKTLTYTEIQQNYNAQKSRFNLQ